MENTSDFNPLIFFVKWMVIIWGGVYLWIKVFTAAQKNDPLEKQDKRLAVPFFISAVFLLIATIGESHERDFYTALRWVVFLTGCFGMYITSNLANKKHGFSFNWPFLISIVGAILFNPFLPAHFKRDIWQLIDIFYLIFFALVGFILLGKTKNNK